MALLLAWFVPYTCVTDSGTVNRALELVYKGYCLADYRAAASDPNYRIVPPVWSALTANAGHLPPLAITHPAGRPPKGPRKRARIDSNGEHNTSSRTYAIYDAERRRAGAAGVRRRPAAGGGAADVHDLSQGPSQGEQA